MGAFGTLISAKQSGSWNVGITGSLPTGSNTIGKVNTLADATVGSAVPAAGFQVGGKDGSGNFRAISVSNTGVVDVAFGGSLPAGTNSIGKVTIDSGTAFVVPEASAAGAGLSMYRKADLNRTADAIKGAAGRLYGLQFYNPNTTMVYLHFWDNASPTVGTDPPAKSIPVPESGYYDMAYTVPITFATAISTAVSTVVDGTGDPASVCLLNADFK